MTLALHSVSAVKATDEPTTFIVTCKITDLNNETYECDYVTREGDGFGLNPTIRQWLEDHPDFPIVPYEPPAPPTPEQIRADMLSLTARQFRLGLVAGGKSPSMVDLAINSMPEGAMKETAKIEWEYATTFRRTHPLIDTLAAALELSPEDVDALWTAALNL